MLRVSLLLLVLGAVGIEAIIIEDLKMAQRRQFRGVSAFSLLAKGFPTSRLIKCYPADMGYPAIAIVANKFGRQWSNLKKWTDAQKGPHAVEVHFMSGPSRKKRTVDVFDLWPHMTATQLNKRLENKKWPSGLELHIQRLRRDLNRSINENTILYISPELEDNLSDEAYVNLLGLFKEAFKGWEKRPRWVRSLGTGGKSAPRGVLIESHGKDGLVSADIYNPDGVSLDVGDSEKYFDKMSEGELLKAWREYDKAKVLFIWSASIQGVSGAKNFFYPKVTERSYIVTDRFMTVSKKILKEGK